MISALTSSGASNFTAVFVHRAPGWGWKPSPLEAIAPAPPLLLLLEVIAWDGEGEAMVLSPTAARLQASSSLEGDGVCELVGVYALGSTPTDLEHPHVVEARKRLERR